jgi:hypothetical protein
VAKGSDAAVIASGSYTTIESTLIAVVAFASVACMVKGNMPVFVGLPDMTPVVGSRDNPAGRELPAASDQVYGVLPPAADRVWLYAAPTVPKGRDAVAMDSESYTSIESGFVTAVEFPSVAFTVKVTVPVAVGLPDMTPVVGSRDNPAGRRLPVASDQVYGVFPPAAVTVWLYAAFTMPKERDCVVMPSGSYTVMERAPVAIVEFASLTCIVKAYVPAVVGVPEMTPVEGSRVNPAGRRLP